MDGLTERLDIWRDGWMDDGLNAALPRVPTTSAGCCDPTLWQALIAFTSRVSQTQTAMATIAALAVLVPARLHVRPVAFPPAPVIGARIFRARVLSQGSLCIQDIRIEGDCLCHMR